MNSSTFEARLIESDKYQFDSQGSEETDENPVSLNNVKHHANDEEQGKNMGFGNDSISKYNLLSIEIKNEKRFIEHRPRNKGIEEDFDSISISSETHVEDNQSHEKKRLERENPFKIRDFYY